MVEEKRIAIMLLFLSNYRAGNGAFSYVFNGKPNKGIGSNQTSYAPTQFLLDASIEDKNAIEKIFCITSRMVADGSDEKNIIEGKTALEHYKEMLKEVCLDRGIEAPEVISIPYDYILENGIIEEDKSGNYAMKIYKSIDDEIKNLAADSQIDVYIDYTGGFRDTSFLMTTIIRYLEFSNVRCKKIIYSKLDRDVNTILDIRNIYDMFKIINGVNDFVTTGHVEQLSDVYKDVKAGAAKGFLEALDNFSDAISLCDIKEIDAAKENIKTELENFSKDTERKEDVYLEMLKSMIPLIKQKMYLDADGGISYPMLIKWCLDNRLLQQAITIYIEKMPAYYKEEVLGRLFSRLPLCRHKKFKVQGANDEEKAAAMIVTDFYMVLYASVADGFRTWQLKKLVSDVCMENGSKDAVVELCVLKSELREIAGGRRDGDRIKSAINSLIEELDGYEDRQEEKHCIVGAGKEYDYNGFIKYLCDLWGSTAYYQYLLFGTAGQEERKGAFSNKAYAVKRMYTAIKAVKEGRNMRLVNDLKTCGIEGEEALTKLKDILELYLVLKIMRNRVNHASTGEDRRDEIKAMRMLNNCSGFVNELNIYSCVDGKELLEFKYNTLEKIIEKGLLILKESSDAAVRRA